MHAVISQLVSSVCLLVAFCSSLFVQSSTSVCVLLSVSFNGLRAQCIHVDRGQGCVLLWCRTALDEIRWPDTSAVMTPLMRLSFVTARFQRKLILTKSQECQR